MPRRYHPRRRHARPASPPQRGKQPRRRFLPTPRSPRTSPRIPPNHHPHPPTSAYGWGTSKTTGKHR
jgi:hypothetical protein